MLNDLLIMAGAPDVAAGGLNLKNLFIFMLVVVPTMIILTRLFAWYFGKLKARKDNGLVPEPRTDEKVVKPFLTYEEYRKELTGDGSIDDFLARCHAGAVPEKPNEMTLMEISRKKLADIQRRIQGNQPSGGVLLRCNDCGRSRTASLDGTFPPCHCWSEPS